jgi:hypothetical protein
LGRRRPILLSRLAFVYFLLLIRIIYQENLKDFVSLKREFNEAAEAIIKGNCTTEQRKIFADAARRYWIALKVDVKGQSHLAVALETKSLLGIGHDKLDDLDTVGRLDYLNQQNQLLNANIDSFNKQVARVAVAVADHQLNNIKLGENVILNDIIPHVKNAYDYAYTKEHNPFMRWLKSFFIKSDRAMEVDFLNKLSQTEGCNEIIRAQAVSLVHNKILETEWFGGSSKLGKLLGNLLEGKFNAQKGEHGKLTDFIRSHQELQEAMPESLQTYLTEHDQDYSGDAIPKIQMS